MEKIYFLGDVHTATAFRLSGVNTIISDKSNALNHLKNLSRQDDAAIVIITRDLAEDISDEIYRINLNSVTPVIIEIPGIDDDRGFGKSPLAYITEALGVSI